MNKVTEVPYSDKIIYDYALITNDGKLKITKHNTIAAAKSR